MVSEAMASSVDTASVDPALVDMGDLEGLVALEVPASEASEDTAWEVLVASEDLEALEDTAASEEYPVAFRDLVDPELPQIPTFKTQLQVLTRAMEQ